MKRYLFIFISILLLLLSCSGQIQSNNNRETEKKPANLYPIQIEFRALGKGSNLPPTIFEINKDTVFISTRNPKNIRAVKNYTLQTSSTQFEELLSNFSEKDLTGNKDYYNGTIRGGRQMIFKSNFGTKKFTNVFPISSRKAFTKPDTIGLEPFELIDNHANQLWRDLTKKEK